MIENGSAKRYILYSVGEITLVVIGILIALQINNWNEQRKANQLSQELYILLRESIMSDTTAFRRRMEEFEEALNSANYLRDKILSNGTYELQIDTALVKILRVRSPESDYKIFDRILATGIERIDDTVLKNEILHYFEDSKAFINLGKRTRDLLLGMYPKYMTSHQIGVAAKPEDWEELKMLNEFKVALDYCIWESNRLIVRTEHRIDLAKYILKTLEEEISLDKTQLENIPYTLEMTPRDSLY